jgi:ribonucleotide monophosphatase NagD (HAD superfamily)
MIQGVLIDLSGVLYVGDKPVPGAAAAMTRLRASGLPARFITNTTRTPRDLLVTRLASLGFDLSAEDVFTPAAAARQILTEQGLTPHFLIHPALAEDFHQNAGTGPKGRALVIGDAGEALPTTV